jgi:hypothetical protein
MKYNPDFGQNPGMGGKMFETDLQKKIRTPEAFKSGFKT